MQGMDLVLDRIGNFHLDLPVQESRTDTCTRLGKQPSYIGTNFIRY